ncbi:MAG: methylenetetrahydrofolate reductase [Planctomycetota bacterium]|jgi:methylenetetrahydrofolate reductase (NADPH)
MKVTNIWESGQKPTVSFELFPPRSTKAAEKLEKAVDELVALKPDFVSVTFGAGGSTREGSHQLIEKLKNEKGQEVIAYFAGYGLGPEDITSVLDSYQGLGIENILVVRGDPPHDQENFEPHPQSLPHASDLMEFIKPRYDFCIGVAGYPEGHIEAESKEKDIEYLKLKVDKGAEYIISNYFYNDQYYFDFVERCRAIGIEVPILAGVMPIYSVKMMEMLAGLCGATITDELRQGIEALPEDDKEALVNFGIEFAVRQCKDLLRVGVPGLHIYTMDRSISSVAIVERLRKDGLL